MYPQVLLFALLLSFAGFLFVAPGAVQIFGMPSKEESGRISLAGPATNIAIAIVFISLSSIVASLEEIFLLIGAINSFLAFFNLIPFGPLDGRKVMAWNIGAWAVAIAASVFLTAISWMRL